ncbi:hypothetical protein BOX15_Mlig027944g1, partial [Macrostomum lignano]
TQCSSIAMGLLSARSIFNCLARSSMPLLIFLLLVVCMRGCLAKHWCVWTFGQCSVTCGDEGVLRRTRVCSCKRNRSSLVVKIKDKFVELINRDCRRLSPQSETVKCPDLPQCDQDRPSANQIIAACIITIVLLCVLFASAKTWVPALYKYYFVDRERRRRRRQQQQQQLRPEQALPRQASVTNQIQQQRRNSSSSDNMSVSFESSNGHGQSIDQPQPELPLEPPPYHDAVYGEVAGEPPPSYTEAVKEQRLQMQQQQQAEEARAATSDTNVDSSVALETAQLPGPSDTSNIV